MTIQIMLDQVNNPKLFRKRRRLRHWGKSYITSPQLLDKTITLIEYATIDRNNSLHLFISSKDFYSAGSVSSHKSLG